MQNFMQFMVKRLLSAVIVLFGVSIVAFGLMRLAPGNPAALMLPDNATVEQIAAVEAKMGLNKPLIQQYFIYIGDVLHGNLGTSIFFNRSCGELIFGRLPATGLLTFAAVAVSILVSFPMGIISGIKKGSAIDFFSMVFALLGMSMSQVWLGLLFILFFGVFMGVLPTQGYGSFRNLILPALTLGLPLAALVTRMLRSGMYEVLEEDYITATKARGIGNFKIYTRYALKNALLPTITIIGMQIGQLLAGAIIVEQVFGWPGLGSLTVKAINMRDFPLIQSILLVTASLFVIINILVDIIYVAVDPRMSLN
ncbi:peptide ABC transporter permease [Lacrimispora amygdalina]|uniref:ABC transporter permease n=1 Tax=Lacrimispora amygdalina TaxID=253257 RepID=A0A3E2N6X1_9FIRM|nr:ABC transporter permease [Clostridium indicum]RFZ76745.1 ABC transporter permease [Clostridium indicum]